MTRFLLLGGAAMSLLLAAAPAAARDTSCRLDFDMAGWSVFYKTASAIDAFFALDERHSKLVRELVAALAAVPKG